MVVGVVELSYTCILFSDHNFISHGHEGPSILQLVQVGPIGNRSKNNFVNVNVFFE